MKFHLQVSSCESENDASDTSPTSRYGGIINKLLEDLWDEKEEGLSTRIICPLEYRSHIFESASAGSIVQIVFQLKDRIEITLDQALKVLCLRIFDPRYKHVLNNLSSSGLYGLSPVKDTSFENIWNAGFLLHTISTGGQNLQSLKDEYLNRNLEVPLWLATCCTILLGIIGYRYNLGAWAAGVYHDVGYANIRDPSKWEIVADADEVGASIPENCLLILESRVEISMSDREDENEIKGGLQDSLQSIETAVTNLESLKGCQNTTPEAYLAFGSALFSIAEQIALLYTSKPTFTIYRSLFHPTLSTHQRSFIFKSLFTGAAATTLTGPVGESFAFAASQISSSFKGSSLPLPDLPAETVVKDLNCGGQTETGVGQEYIQDGLKNPEIGEVPVIVTAPSLVVGKVCLFSFVKVHKPEVYMNAREFGKEAGVLARVNILLMQLSDLSVDVRLLNNYKRIMDERKPEPGSPLAAKHQVWNRWWEKAKASLGSQGQSGEFTEEDQGNYFKGVKERIGTLMEEVRADVVWFEGQKTKRKCIVL